MAKKKAVAVTKKKPFISQAVMARIKSFVWRAMGMAVVAGLTYVLGLGSIWLVNVKVLVDTMFLVLAGLVVGEITKYYNTKTTE